MKFYCEIPQYIYTIDEKFKSLKILNKLQIFTLLKKIDNSRINNNLYKITMRVSETCINGLKNDYKEYSNMSS